MDPYQILGVAPNAGVKEIKQAFRKRASVLHPDVNSSPTAHEDFIDLTEAYENLLREKTGNIYNNSTNQYTRSSKVYSDDDLKTQARERAKQNAQMKYQEFVNSDYYKSKMSQYNTFELWVSFIFLIPLLCFQIMLFLNLSIPSAFLLFFLIVPISYNALIVIKKTTFRQVLTDTIYFFKTDLITTFLVIFFNITVFSIYGFVTFIPMKVMLSIYIVIPFIMQLFRELVKIQRNENIQISILNIIAPYSQKIAIMKRPFLKIWGFLPFLFSIFLILNGTFYLNKHTETQKYKLLSERSETIVLFENEAYNNYWGVQYFRDFEAIKENNVIKLTIKKGLFGISVIDDYSLSYH